MMRRRLRRRRLSWLRLSRLLGYVLCSAALWGCDTFSGSEHGRDGRVDEGRSAGESKARLRAGPGGSPTHIKTPGEGSGYTERPASGEAFASGATLISLPLASPDALDSLVGQRVRFAQPLTVTDTYNLGRYGEVELSSGGRLVQPTQVVAKGRAALERQAQNDLNRILIDDGQRTQNPDPIVFPAPGLTAARTLRCGDSVQDLTGTLEYAFGRYRVIPDGPLRMSAAPRPALRSRPAGALRAATLNLANFFNGDGRGGDFPTPRGADSLDELQRQEAKLVAAILALQADIVGVVEVENDGYGPRSALAQLVNRLNDRAPLGERYDFVRPGRAQLGGDAIAVGLIYRADSVALDGAAAVLDERVRVSPRFNASKNRPVLAQGFVHPPSGLRLTVAVTHLKSKGSSCASIGDPDLDDGQGNCNLTRTNAARSLAAWLAQNPTGGASDRALILGDLNAYAQEDPVAALRQAGYRDLVAVFEGGDAHSFVFFGQAGLLDHALANAALWPAVVQAFVWHTNADEPRVLDYNLEFKSERQVTSLYRPDAYRASDHDAVVVDLAQAR